MAMVFKDDMGGSEVDEDHNKKHTFGLKVSTKIQLSPCQTEIYIDTGMEDIFHVAYFSISNERLSICVNCSPILAYL